jgi:hypothetical protein
MSTPPQHLSGRTLFPGAFLAVFVTVGALVALAVVIAVGPDGPARLWLDGGGDSVSLNPREATMGGATLPGGPVALLAGASTGGLIGGVSLASPVTAAERPGAVRLRANTRVQRRSAARTPSAGRPRTPTPASTPSPIRPVSQSPATAPAASATPAPAGGVEKTRGRGTPAAEDEVAKQRVPSSTAAAPAPTAAPPPSSTPTATAPELRPVATSEPTPDATDGGLHRVPSP